MEDTTQALDSVEVVSNSEGQADYAVGKHPWRRFFARGVDNVVNPFLVFLWIGVMMALFAPDNGAAFIAWTESVHVIVDLILSLAIATVINAILLATLGTTLGKFIFGVRVREADGRGLSLIRALRREVLVWFRGLALGIPIVALFTMGSAYNKLDNDGFTSWDDDMKLEVTHRPQTTLQSVLWVAVAGAFILAKLVMVIMNRIAGW